MALFGSSSEITTLGLGELRGSPLDNPAIPISSPAIWDYMTGGEATASGEKVNEANALQITTVCACTTLLATMAASLPLRLMERRDAGHIEAIDQNLHYLLSAEPNPEMTAVSPLWSNLSCSLAYTGNAYAQLERFKFGSGQSHYSVASL